jgi:GDP-L-fucose synthase
MNKDDLIFVAGHRGMVGSATVRELKRQGFDNLVFRSRDEVDLLDFKQVDNFFSTEKPRYVIDAAAKVGGILANDTYPADFIRDNLRIQTNLIEAAHKHGTEKFVFLGSSCIYPKLAPQPMREEYLLTGPLEPTNEWYAIAKIAGIKMCQAYRKQHGFNAICLMPTNLYGPGDNFDLKTSHVLPALIRKIHEAKVAGSESVTIWGTGKPRREFLHVDDLADAIVFLAENYNSEEIINVGAGEDIAIEDLAVLISNIVGFEGALTFDTDMPDGTPRKLLDVTRLQDLGWAPRITLNDGIAETYAWFLENSAVSATIEGGSRQ